MNVSGPSIGNGNLPPAILLMGPTATGKSRAALALVERLPVEIVSVDSVMVYRGMDIGTAKPSRAERQAVRHHLINIREPEETYSAAEFRQNALAAMAEIIARGKTPLLVGGTLLYFRALMHGLAPLPEADPGYRAELDRDASRVGWPALHARLATIDPATAARVHPNDAQRIQRALEVHHATGETLSERLLRSHEPPPYRLLPLALWPASREALHGRIAARFSKMIAAGFIDEVARLKARPDLDAAHPSMRAVGYRQVWRFLDGRSTREQAIADATAATRRYAKRQMTWLRSEDRARRFDAADPSLLRHLKTAVARWL
jgi:tRNA dimethylallyltransferase